HRFVAHPCSIEPMDLEHEARPAIARLSDEIVARAGDLLVAGGIPSGLDPDEIARALDPSWASPAARLAIARAIIALRPACQKTDVCKRSLTPLEAARRRGRGDKDTKSRANTETSALSLR